MWKGCYLLACICFHLLQPPASAGSLINAGATVSGVPTTECTPKKMLWFTAIAGIGNHLSEYKRNLRAAVMSAKERAPSLIPNVLITMEDLEAGGFVKWYERMGGYVHPWNLTFFQHLHDAVHKHKWQTERWLTQYGAYLRIDIPLVMQRNLAGKLDPNEVELSHVLYTDCDILFLQDINTCTAPPPPPVLSLGIDVLGMENTGTTFINVSALGQHHSRLIQFGDHIKWAGVYDQSLIASYFKGKLSPLPREYNWSPAWGVNSKAVIEHFHGPKPERCLGCLIMSLHEHGRKNFPTAHCNCPPIYLRIFSEAVNRDQGRGYTLGVIKFHQYLLASFKAGL